MSLATLDDTERVIAFTADYDGHRMEHRLRWLTCGGHHEYRCIGWSDELQDLVDDIRSRLDA